MKIKNIEQLRNLVLDSLEKLATGKLEINKCSIIAKSAETIMSSIKLQLMYSAMINEEPNIDFVHDCHRGKKITNVNDDKTIINKLVKIK